MSKVTIIGAGNMARGIGTRVAVGGGVLQILAPNPADADELARELTRGGDRATSGGVDDTITGDVVVLATPYDGALQFVESRGAELQGKIVVDITNPVDFATFDSLVTPPGSSAAQEISKRLPGGVPVVKAFNTTFAATLVAGTVADENLDVLIAGDDADAKSVVTGLVESGGMRAIDAGLLRRAQQLEQLGFLHMTLQDNLDSGYGSTIKFLTP